MNVNGTPSASTYFAATAARTSGFNTSESADAMNTSASSNGTKDTATFSEAARAAAKQSVEASSEVTFSQIGTDVPVEAYAVPSWQSGYYRDITNEWALGTAGNYVDPKYAAYDAASASDREEYAALLQTHVLDLYKNNGLSDTGERYAALKTIPGLNEKLHQEFTANVNADSRMVSLMSKLGLTVS